MSFGKQAASLAIMHAADVLQPLIVLPYAAAVLGPVHFGQYAYAMSIGQLAASVTDYGFHWTAQCDAARMRDDQAAVAALFARVTLTKIFLLAAAALFFFALTGGVLSLSVSVLACAFLLPLGGVVYPVWLMVGLERAWPAAVASVIARCLALVAFFVLVRSPDDITQAVATQSAVPLVTGLLTLPYVLPIGFTGFRATKVGDVVDQLRRGWRGFLFSLVERALAILPVPIIGYYAGFAAVGQYSLAEKFVSATRPFFRVLMETFSPRVAYYAQHAPAAGIQLIARASASLLVGAAMSVSLFALGPYVIRTVFGAEFEGAIPILRLLSVMPLLLNANVLTSHFYLFGYGHERAWTRLTIVGLLTFLACTFSLKGVLDPPMAVAAAVIARECVVAAASTGFFIAYALTFVPGEIRADWRFWLWAESGKAPRRG